MYFIVFQTGRSEPKPKFLSVCKIYFLVGKKQKEKSVLLVYFVLETTQKAGRVNA